MNAASGASHSHFFLGERHDRHSRRTMIVVALTAVAMVVEIAAGYAFGSMALLADGFHMSTHAGALLLAALAYRYASRHADDPAFTFGTGKIGDLAGFASAIVLGMIALLIAVDSLHRLASPQPIRFDEAILVAVLGLGVNLISAWLLHDGEHGHDHDPSHSHHNDDDHGHHHDHHDHNFRAAYVHVAADALTSVLAIAALVAGRTFDWVWLDAAAGVLGAVMIALWSIRLMRDSAGVLVDRVADPKLAHAIEDRLERHGARVTDLHLWRVGPGHNAAVISVSADEPQTPARYKTALSGLHGLSHVTIEVTAA
ncbi:cation transporter [Kaistia algarum]|uniref:CDF family Co(II)/Ni(II) efflux transporter DmeF n=1 Tax=Kaistia algarum TaxID=2083279 RepID=UPI000CE85F6C|nr:CDF family Co(II)/Ni(II) efflux transporter DmeF [Kaistia algarum]MCX5512414.1 CDF family Co(II)/Ni(II) efflux transporter DmeF [Kaistia algarum]PPE80494.1 cation transporter [Kaistia algarum]